VIADVDRHGWFDIPGVQTGERKLKERIRGLTPLLAVARGGSVLDLGCAEGMIGKWLMEAGGAVSLLGLDKHAPFLETAREVFAEDRRATFAACDFDQFEEWRALNPLQETYDVVLALNIIHKLARPAQFLGEISRLTRGMLAIALPADVINDARSGNMPVDPVSMLRGKFALVSRFEGARHSRKGHLGIRMIFRRTGVAA
jgi:2-polyprenyl-3-methyl-5-hydroxy-6-metoxy-1,4-benzoquinol methylase